MMEEIWKPIPNWEGLYEISTIGNVRSVDKNVGMRWRDKITTKFVKGKHLTPQYDKDGYKIGSYKKEVNTTHKYDNYGHKINSYKNSKNNTIYKYSKK